MNPPITHPVIGFRAWYPKEYTEALMHLMIPNMTPVDQIEYSGQLRSCYVFYTWERGTNEATCMSKDHRTESGEHQDTATAPLIDLISSQCNCGIQAHHDYSDSDWYFSERQKARSLMVFGIIKGWGKAQVHPDGWRAQFAEIKAIIPSPNMAAAQAAARYYHVPLLSSLKNIDIIASDFGKKVPEECRPQREYPARSVTIHPQLSAPKPKATPKPPRPPLHGYVAPNATNEDWSPWENLVKPLGQFLAKQVMKRV